MAHKYTNLSVSDSQAPEKNSFIAPPSNPEVLSPQTTSNVLNRKLVLFLAMATGLAVANLYYVQPVLADMGREFNIPNGQAGILSTLTQIGYTIGLLLIVPLGDAIERRSLIVRALLAVSLALAGVAVAPGFIWLAIAITLVGITTVIPQLIVPLAASLAKPSERGRAIGNIMSGLLIGVLLSRTVSGYINTWLGWRAMYLIAVGLMLLLALVLWWILPVTPPKTRLNYRALLTSLLHLIKTEPVLRESALFGGLAFGALSAFWVTLTFLLAGPPYHYGSDVVGLFGLVGVGGALMASLVGKLSDRINPRYITGVSMAGCLLSFGLVWWGGQFLPALVAGVLFLDLGTQAVQISNQNRIYSLKSEAGSRLNTVYMVSYFAGGSIGSFMGVYGWSLLGWNGVSLVGSTLLTLALIIYALNRNKTKT
jgi:predicted MFS family arabinose efflux permease